MHWSSRLGVAVSILVLSRVRPQLAVIKIFVMTAGQAKPPAVLVPMAFDHEEDVGMEFNKCFYIATNDSVGEKIGVTLRETCPSSSYMIFQPTWQKK